MPQPNYVARKRLVNGAAFAPGSNLNGGDFKSSRSISSPTQPRSDSPPAKRQRIEEDNTHTQAQFALIPIFEGTVDRPGTRKRSFDSSQQTLESQSSNAKGSQSVQQVVPEYRATRNFVKPTPKRRRRHPPQANGEQPIIVPDSIEDDDGEDNDGEDDDGDGEVEIVEGPEAATTSPGLPGNVQSIEKFVTRFVKRPPNATTGARRMDQIIDKAIARESISKSGESSPDELAPEEQDMKKSTTKRPVTPSPSLSKRGDILRTKFEPPSHTGSHNPTGRKTTLDRSADIIGPGFRLVRAVSGDYKYDANALNGDDGCFLKLFSMSYILLPANSDGERQEQYDYCTINLKKVQRIAISSKHDPACYLASIRRSTDATVTAPGKLIVEFESPKDLKSFEDWARINRDLTSGIGFNVHHDEDDKIRKEFVNMMTKANRTTTIRDADQRGVRNAREHLQGDDIKLMEHNERQARSANPPRASTRQEKAKNAMRPYASTSQSKTEVTIIPDNPKFNNPPRRTRSTFALIKDPSPEFDSPEFKRWTAEHEGWEKRWRNSLVFPPQGKSRAIVDREDISRLDEGQFLNDNLIIFYLRYLQQSLEDRRPDLAQRIYFQNTFFYEKLKSTRTSHGINYNSVKTWTSKIDLFTKDYIIVPINEFSHWYVAIIYNAPKLLPTSDKVEVSDTQASDTVTIEEDAEDSRRACSASPQGERLGESTSGQTVITVDSDMTNHLSQMSICSPSLSDDVAKQAMAALSTEQEKDVQICHQQSVEKSREKISKGGAEQSSPVNSSLQQRKAGKKNSVTARKHSLDQPRIITLDSLGLAHSPACGVLKQYLIAELKDKKGIEIPSPKALGTTAKDIPCQTNHCDCGLFLLGYIQEFLKDPDRFVRTLLQHDTKITWDLNPSRLRNEIRDLIFELQEKQQKREDDLREEKRNKAEQSRKRDDAEVEQQSYQHTSGANNLATARYVSESVKEDTVPDEVDTIAKPRTKSPAPEVSRLETRRGSDSEGSHHIPGSYPRSPTMGSAGTRSYYAVTIADDRRSETPKFVSPLPSTSSGPDSDSKPSPIRGIDVDDLEAIRKQRQRPSHSHHGNKSISSPVEIDEDIIQYPGDYNRTSIKPRSREATATPITSPHFAGRKQGDKMASAKLRENPAQPPSIVDISD